MTGLPLAGSGEEASQASSFCFGRSLAMPLTSSKTILHLKNCLEAGRAAAQLMVLVSKLALRESHRVCRAFSRCPGLGTEDLNVSGDSIIRD